MGTIGVLAMTVDAAVCARGNAEEGVAWSGGAWAEWSRVDGVDEEAGGRCADHDGSARTKHVTAGPSKIVSKTCVGASDLGAVCGVACTEACTGTAAASTASWILNNTAALPSYTIQHKTTNQRTNPTTTMQTSNTTNAS